MVEDCLVQVPVFQHDFGCCAAWIDGESSLKQARLDLDGEFVSLCASRAEPESTSDDRSITPWLEVENPTSNG